MSQCCSSHTKGNFSSSFHKIMGDRKKNRHSVYLPIYKKRKTIELNDGNEDFKPQRFSEQEKDAEGFWQKAWALSR